MLKRTVDRYLEFIACLFSKSLESHPREPVWDVPYCQRARQVLVGNYLGTQARTYREDVCEEFPRYQHSRYSTRRPEVRIQEWIVGRLGVDSVGYGQYHGSGRALVVR